MANDWQARGVELIIIMFYVKNTTPRNPLKIVNMIGKMMRQWLHPTATKTQRSGTATKKT